MVKHLSVFVKELNTSNRVIFIISTYYIIINKLLFINGPNCGPLCESFEEYVIQLHYTLQDKIDKGTICLFANKSDSKELFAALHNLEKLNLEFEHLREIIRALIEKMVEFEKKHPVHVTFFKVHSDYWKKNGENLVSPI
ncbi:hypothetical protein Glove_332g17 [Diversispora epigaea]|uniref:Uncharacterized protein n=1 Tax=Diversispora epigaea TaxID=1348612 RepID=A0A397HMG9_9GLOM|nr:hypothetical protein Glove_332g17 [Diversispora epigaea]